MLLYKNIILLFILIFGFSFCSARFVKKDQLKILNKKYSSVYQIKKEVDIGNNKKARLNQKVRLYFISNSESIKVYAYPHDSPRESAVGDNILYLFEDDFPNEEWDHDLLEKKLAEIIKPIK